MIYLDNAATTLRKPPQVIAVGRAMGSFGNSARGTHEGALTASRTIYDTRCKLAALFGCPRPDHVVFTANSTEALNITINGLVRPGDHVLSTDLEHNSVLRPLYRLRDDIVPAVRPLPQPGFSSTGLTEENVQVVFAQVEPGGQPRPDSAELIEPFTVARADLRAFLDANQLPIGTRYQLILELLAL